MPSSMLCMFADQGRCAFANVEWCLLPSLGGLAAMSWTVDLVNSAVDRSAKPLFLSKPQATAVRHRTSFHATHCPLSHFPPRGRVQNRQDQLDRKAARAAQHHCSYSDACHLACHNHSRRHLHTRGRHYRQATQRHFHRQHSQNGCWVQAGPIHQDSVALGARGCRINIIKASTDFPVLGGPFVGYGARWGSLHPPRAPPICSIDLHVCLLY